MHYTELKKMLQVLLEQSEVLDTADKIRTMKGQGPASRRNMRGLRPGEIEILEKNGNRCISWKNIAVTEDFSADHIFGNTFHGECSLGRFTGRTTLIHDHAPMPTGIRGSTIIGSHIGDECIIHDAGIISNYVIMNESSISRVDSLTASGEMRFGNGIEIPVGTETGGREVLSFAELSIPAAEAAACGAIDREILNFCRDTACAYIDRITLSCGVVGSRTSITNTKKIADSFIGSHVRIDGAQAVLNSTVLGGDGEATEISHGAFVKDSCIQWGCSVTSLGIVEASVLTEHSHVERHGKVLSSIIGPNTGISEGEVTSSLLGPFVGFHHQSMLIAALWPGGKGNVGYGANIGSNHTSRAPDQEMICGEGMFFGLGVNIKYPCNFAGAPYSIIATAVETQPQRVRFPFSLIKKPEKIINGIPGGFNEIFPGWVLSDNLYAILRNEEKFKKRDRAKRTEFTFQVFREEIVDMMAGARDRLMKPKKISEYYMEDVIEGLGKNFITDEARIKGIESYNFFIEYYVLKGLLHELNERHDTLKNFDPHEFYHEKTGSREWQHVKIVMAREGYSKRPMRENMERLIFLYQTMVAWAFKSKERDDIRGRKIIDDYDLCHVPADRDPFITGFRARCDESVKLIQGMLKKLED